MAEVLKVLQLQTRYNAADTNSDLGEQILRGLPAERFEVVNGYLEGEPAADTPLPTWRQVFFAFTEKDMSGLRLKVRRRLLAFCREEGFDVVLLHRFKTVNLFMHLNKILRIPRCIGVAHGFGEYDRFYRRWQARRSIDDCWRFVGVSPAVADYLIALRCGFTKANTVAITNALDIDLAESLQLSRVQARQALQLPRDSLIVGAIGRLVPIKGHVYLIRAFAALSGEYPHVDLAIIGGGRENDNLVALIAELGLQERVHLCGTRPDAMRYVKAFDVFVMPSLQEGLGLALLEGMCGRLPVLGSDIPAMRPLLDGAGGRHFTPGDVPALSEQLRACLADSEARRAEDGERAYRYLRREHDIEDFRDKYRALLEGDRPPAGAPV
ncbi:Glycosyltransferase involved in cell wall bisynthesis [Pseudomonas flavescens]|uniref:Glycosyltransferase involved in cell wall bisynthesis n=1 Tax=Phytopseudomonas flavescens TaxID=29435 RepID=A0A1G8PBT4_9GAMM|nr:glycosyltransferase [Pseudomonas flavescens]SDI89932.1 Glycosyltransferase involved in cell wall bisynthesis [Pseudomonas flavescens]